MALERHALSAHRARLGSANFDSHRDETEGILGEVYGKRHRIGGCGAGAGSCLATRRAVSAMPNGKRMGRQPLPDEEKSDSQFVIAGLDPAIPSQKALFYDD